MCYIAELRGNIWKLSKFSKYAIIIYLTYNYLFFVFILTLYDVYLLLPHYKGPDTIIMYIRADGKIHYFLLYYFFSLIW